uniref:Uncharacterized protein n=1 Tax=Nothobranchius furzeri TaxID=105023 RepID=A0A8C6KK73_NOTFU
ITASSFLLVCALSVLFLHQDVTSHEFSFNCRRKWTMWLERIRGVCHSRVSNLQPSCCEATVLTTGHHAAIRNQ